METLMNPAILTVLVFVPTLAVVVAMFIVLWRERSSPRAAAVAIAAGIVLALWALLVTVLGRRGVFVQPDTRTFPPIGKALLLAFAGLTVSLAASPSLRGLLANQKNLIRLNVWRLMGVLFLLLMRTGQMPALWALPSGLGDILVGATAFAVASRLDRPGGRRLAIVFNVVGLVDLVVAVALGITTSAGPARLFHTVPTSEVATRFPLVLVPAFLVPLAFALHVVSLLQLLGRSWAPRTAAAGVAPLTRLPTAGALR
jgi:hypothetical protein